MKGMVVELMQLGLRTWGQQIAAQENLSTGSHKVRTVSSLIPALAKAWFESRTYGRMETANH